VTAEEIFGMIIIVIQINVWVYSVIFMIILLLKEMMIALFSNFSTIPLYNVKIVVFNANNVWILILITALPVAYQLKLTIHLFARIYVV